MRRRLAIVLLCLSILVFGSCSPAIVQEPVLGESGPKEIEEVEAITHEDSSEEIVAKEVDVQTPLISDEIDFPEVKEGYGLWGATVTVEGVYPGWAGSDPIIILNGEDQRRTFHLMLQQPGDTIHERYDPFPEKYFDWFAIEDLEPLVAAGGVKKVSVTLSVPYNFPQEMRGKSYDARILVEDWSQSGFIQMALQEKWLITFAD